MQLCAICSCSLKSGLPLASLTECHLHLTHNASEYTYISRKKKKKTERNCKLIFNLNEKLFLLENCCYRILWNGRWNTSVPWEFSDFCHCYEHMSEWGSVLLCCVDWNNQKELNNASYGCDRKWKKIQTYIKTTIELIAGEFLRFNTVCICLTMASVFIIISQFVWQKFFFSVRHPVDII